MIAGQLEIQLVANVAKLMTDMDSLNKGVTRHMQGVEKAVTMAKNALGALGIGLSVNAFAGWIKGAINAQDELAKMSQRTGVAVQQLAGLQHAAGLSGASLDAVEKGLKTVSQQLLDASRGLKTSQENFDALGIAVKDSRGQLRAADQVLIEVADRFAALKDGTEKTALATKLFGRAGMDLIPLLNEGSAGIAAMVREGQRLNPVTERSAAMAEQFNDNLDRMKGIGGQVATMIANSALPRMTEWTQKFWDLYSATDAFVTKQDELLKQIGTMTEQQLVAEAMALNASIELTRERREELERLTSRFGTQEAEIRKLREEEERLAGLQANLIAQLRKVQSGYEPVIQVTRQQSDALEDLNRIYAQAAPAVMLTADAYLDMMGVQREVTAEVETATVAMAEADQGLRDLTLTNHNAVISMGQDWEDFGSKISSIFADIVLDGSSAIDSLKRSVGRGAVTGLFDSLLGNAGGKSLTGSILGGASSALGLGSLAGGGGLMAAGSQFLGGLTGGAIGTNSMIATGASSLGAGINGALASIPGWGWALAGAAALTAMFSKKETPSWNAGFLTDPSTPLGKSGHAFQTAAFASGFAPTGFYRRSSQAEAEQVIELFRQLDESIVSMARAAGHSVSLTGLRGLNETLLAGTSGTVFGSGGEKGKPGMALEQQMQMFASQLIESLRGQIEDRDLDAILAAGGVDQMIAKLEEVLTVQQAITTEVTEITSAVEDVTAAIEEAALAEQRLAEERIASFEATLGAARGYFDNLHQVQQEALREQERAIRDRYSDQLRIEEELHNRRLSLFQSLMAYTSSLRTGDLTILSPRDQLAFAQSQFRGLASTALNTSLSMNERLTAAEGLQGAADAYLRAGQGVYASSSAYKDIFGEVMNSLDAAKFLGTNRPFDATAIENAMLAELQSLNAQVGTLPAGIAQQLAGMMANLINQGLIAGKSKEFIANTITGLGPEAVAGANQYLSQIGAGKVEDYATPASSIQAYHAYLGSQSGATEESVVRAIVEEAHKRGLTANHVGAALGKSPELVADILGRYGIPMFADGGEHMGGLRIVGERGPELEYTGPSHIFSNADSRQMLATNAANTQDNGEIKQLLAQLVALLTLQNKMIMAGTQMDSSQKAEMTRILEALLRATASKSGIGSVAYDNAA